MFPWLLVGWALADLVAIVCLLNSGAVRRVLGQHALWLQLFFAGVLLASSPHLIPLTMVPEGHVGVIFRFQAPTSSELTPGLHMVLPIDQRSRRTLF
jgi:regulator of protease activity HflC (stomatin/prohibitin superfamily)